MPTHREHVLDQFSKKADLFATAPALTNDDTLQLLIKTTGATKADTVLDLACGAGVVVCAFAAVARHATGIDLEPAMIERARALAAEKRLKNVTWQVGNVLPLPFPDESFSIVTSRYAFHHFENPAQVLAEMKRVCARGGRILLADMAASENPEKAAALNHMEKLRDPSHVCSMSVTGLQRLFHSAGLAPREPMFYRVQFEVESLLKGSNPLPGDDVKVREFFEHSLRDDGMELNVRRDTDGVCFNYQIAMLVAQKV